MFPSVLSNLFGLKSWFRLRERRVTEYPRWKQVRIYVEALEDRTLPVIPPFGFAINLTNFFESAMTTDVQGNVYMAGFSGEGDPVVAKYSPSGAYIWANDLGPNSGLSTPVGIAVDGSGNVYTTGGNSFSSGGSNANSYEGYVLKLSSSGAYDWSEPLATANDATFGNGISSTGIAGVHHRRTRRHRKLRSYKLCRHT
jgi:outer membrane protein assembly factor BamB